MFQKKDEAYLTTMNKMRALIESPRAMQDWFEKKREIFKNLAEE